MGAALAGPFYAGHPGPAAAFTLGSALPDLDVLARLLGRRAFLAGHQTYSHALPIIPVLAAVAGAAGAAAGLPSPWTTAAALAAGMALHSLLDLINTYGITLWAPFSMRRYCREWVFFIDLPATGLTVLVLAASLRAPAAAWALAPGLALYFLWRRSLKLRAHGLALPGTVSLLPTPCNPWRFLGAANAGSRVELFALDVRTGALTERRCVETLDEAWRDRLARLPAWRQMRSLSPLYHVVGVEPTEAGAVVTCRDLRTRQFNTRFGSMRVRIASAAAPQVERFEV